MKIPPINRRYFHARPSISRVLFKLIIYLVLVLPSRSSGSYDNAGRGTRVKLVSIISLQQVGFTIS